MSTPGPDTIHIEVLRLGTTTLLFHHLAKLFTSSIQLGYILTAWKIATICMLLKPDKLPSLTTSYRPISLISSIMKLFERVIEKRLRSHLENIGSLNKHQSGFRRAKSTDDHLFRLSQSIMESFNRGEHAVAAFLDVEKAFDNVLHNGLRYKIFQLDLPTKMTPWHSDVLVGCAIQVNVNGSLSNQIMLIKEKRRLRRQYSQIKDPAVKKLINQLQKQVKEDLRVEKSRGPTGFCPESITFSDLRQQLSNSAPQTKFSLPVR